ncbi:FtsX-like permease family protein [Bifidobacterium aquikefiri]|uniref:FtsX-like permease family protein n=3 Tax=Bifidobacterium aquikefiri TaxID=1653207 RepID=UPI0039ED12D9
MFVFKNAWKSVVRNKGRNILIAIIVAIIAAAATIGLSIRQAADSARATGLEDTSVTAQISVNREKLIAAAQSSSSSSTKPDFSAARTALTSKSLSLADYEKYAKASTVKTGTYYTETSSVSKTDSFQPVSTTDTTSSSSSSSSSSQGATGEGRGGMGGGGFEAEATQAGDFKLVGFSSDTAVKNAANGTFTMTSGKVFGYTSTSNNDVIISKSLADFNKVAVGDTISVTNPYDTSKTISLKIVGIYKNSTDTTTTNNGPQQSNSSDPSNAIYTSISTLKALGLDTSSEVTTTDSSGTSTKSAAAQLSYTYVLGSKSAYTTFTKDVKKAGLSSDYTVSSSDVEEYESSLLPLNNLAKFALTLLLVVLAVGGVVLIVLSLFNVRERKYEVGVLTAMGVKKAKVATQFAIELLIVTMIGLGVGAVAGAVSSVPVSNQLLASQVSQQESQTSSQQAQFGRGANVGAPGSTTTGNSSSTTGSGTGTTGKTTAAPTQGAGNPFSTRAVNYVSSINTTVSISMVGQLLLIGLGLTLISALVGVIFVMRYEPLQILADRS